MNSKPDSRTPAKMTADFPGMTLHRCKQCGAEFSAYPSMGRKFCSRKCAYANPARVVIRPLDRGSRCCLKCGNNFEFKTGGLKNRYCSRRCSGAVIGKRTMPINRRVCVRDESKWMETSCKKCGREVSRRKVTVQDEDRIYCSLKCAIADGSSARAAKTKSALGQYSSEHMYSHAKRGWRTIGGNRVFFRSRMEANYARYLTFLGIEWLYEPKTFWFAGLKQGVVSYTPDFFLVQENRYVECKGWMDPKSKTKLKRMAKYHPSVKLAVFDWKSYRAIESTVGKAIPEWETSR